MNSLQIAAALQTIPLNSMVYASNRLPNSSHTPCGLVVNTDPDTKPGAHWIAIFIDGSRTGEFFDSYGFPPLVATHLKFLRTSCRKWTYNTKELQSLNSTVCGQYCLLYLYFRAKGLSLNDFQAMFSGNTQINDALIRKKYAEIFKPSRVNKSSSCTSVQICCCRRT